MSRTNLNRYRNEQDEPMAYNLAKLVRGLRLLSGERVMASELYDLGEDEPLGSRVIPMPLKTSSEKHYDTRFDRFLVSRGIRRSVLALATGYSRQTVLKKCSGRESMRVSMIAGFVRALRQMGYDVRASYIIDVGED